MRDAGSGINVIEKLRTLEVVYEILVTGATGTLGSEVVKQLAAAGQKGKALVRDPGKAAQIRGSNVEIVEGDFAKTKTLVAALEDVSKVFLLCPACPELAKFEGNVISEARKAGVTHIVKQSAIWAPQEPGIAFGRWNRESEKKLEASGMEWTHLRPDGFMTNMLHFAGTSKGDGSLYAPAVDGRVSMVDPKDVAAVAVKALTEKGHGGKAYPITGLEPLSYQQIAEELAAVTGRKINYINVPDEAAKQGMLSMGAPEWFADALLELYRLIRTGYVSPLSPAVEQIAGKKPRSFDAWAKENKVAFI